MNKVVGVTFNNAVCLNTIIPGLVFKVEVKVS